MKAIEKISQNWEVGIVSKETEDYKTDATIV